MGKIRSFLIRFMYGRRGMDELGVALYVTGLVLYFIGVFTGGILMLLSMVLWILGVFRMMSKNLDKRAKENTWFLSKYRPIAESARQAKNRFKNRKIYKYYRCPGCKSWLKLPRNIGEKTVTCGKCGKTFKKKA